MRADDVFGLLRDGRAWTRSELATTTGLARSTIAARVDLLMRLGLVAPIGDARSTGGRPPALFALDPDARVVGGVDVDASHLRTALTNLSGTILAQETCEKDIAEGPTAVLGEVSRSLRRLLSEIHRPVEDLAAIGIGLPGPVEHATGRPINPPIMPGWHRYDVSGRLRHDFATQVLADNDVNIMTIGERRKFLPDVDDLVLIKVATGIGAGIVSGGVLQRGAQGTAGDLGHVRVPGAANVPCRCGNVGCLEAIAAGPALARTLTERGVAAMSGQDVVELVKSGNPVAVGVVRQAGRDIGEVVAMMVNLINPSVVAIGGELSGAGEYLLAGIREAVYQRSLPLATQNLRILHAQAGSDAAILGASAMAVEHVLSPECVEAASLALTAS